MQNILKFSGGCLTARNLHMSFRESNARRRISKNCDVQILRLRLRMTDEGGKLHFCMSFRESNARRRISKICDVQILRLRLRITDEGGKLHFCMSFRGSKATEESQSPLKCKWKLIKGGRQTADDLRGCPYVYGFAEAYFTFSCQNCGFI